MANEWHKEQLQNAVERVVNTVKAYFPGDAYLQDTVAELERLALTVEYKEYDPL